MPMSCALHVLLIGMYNICATRVMVFMVQFSEDLDKRSNLNDIASARQTPPRV